MSESKSNVVYKITNLTNNKFYIGSTTDSVRRWSEHKGSLERGVHSNVELQTDFNLIKDLDKFKFEILYTYNTIEEARTKEIELLTIYTGNTLCYNRFNNNINVKNLFNKSIYMFNENKSKLLKQYKLSYTVLDDLECKYFVDIERSVVFGVVLNSRKFGKVILSIFTTGESYIEYIENSKQNIIEYDFSLTKTEKVYTLKELKTLYSKTYIDIYVGIINQTLVDYKFYKLENDKIDISVLNTKSNLLSRYDKYGRLICRLNKKEYNKSLPYELKEKLRGVLRKNTRIYLAKGTNYNRAYDGYYYNIGDEFEILPLILIEIHFKISNQKLYFKDLVEAGNYLGITNSSLCDTINKRNGETKSYYIKRVLNTDLENIYDLT